MIKGCIGFVDFGRSNTFFGNAIKLFTWSRWSHSFIVIDEENILEANEHVEVSPISSIRDRDGASYELYEIVEASIGRKAEAIEYCRKNYEGNEYGYMQILFFVFRAIYRLFGQDFRGNIFTQGVICSELTYDYEARVMPQFVTLAKAWGFDEQTCTPQDLYEIVQANPHLYKLIESKQ